MSVDNQMSGHRERVREKFAKLGSFDSYEPYEVLEFLLFYSLPRRDTKAIAKSLIKTFGSLGGVLNADPATLAKQPGIGKTTALFIHALSELSAFVSHENLDTVNGSGDMSTYALKLTQNKIVEELYAIALNTKNEILCHKKIATGKFSSVAADPRDIITFAIESKGAHLALVHNHTNGSVTPSGDDITTTEYIDTLTKAIGVKLIDHIITSDNRYYSFADAGKIQNDRKK